MPDQSDKTQFAWVGRDTHEPCPTRANPGGGMILCTIDDPAHRHMAAHMVPAIRLDMQAGESWSVLDAVEALGRVAVHTPAHGARGSVRDG